MAEPDSHAASDKFRLEAFSDGVFAIAVTLLIIEVGVPHVKEGESLWRALGNQWPSYLGYVIAFVTIGIMWANHHTMLRDIHRIDHTFTVLNLLLLMCVAFMPFPTALLAQYMRDSDNNLVGAVVFGGAFTVTALFWNALWLYASVGRRLIHEHVSESRVRQRTRRFRLGPITYGLTMPAALITPWLSVAMFAALAALYLLPPEE